MKLRDALLVLQLTFVLLPRIVAGDDPSTYSVITLTSLTTVRPSPKVVTSSQVRPFYLLSCVWTILTNTRRQKLS
jgi:hypothetical protein